MRGSYTVEASWIMAITLSVLCATILVSYQIFKEVIGDVTASPIYVDVVSLFYKNIAWSEFLEEVR